MKKILFIACAAFLALGACTGQKTLDVAPTDPSIMYMGRILYTDSFPTFTYPGTAAVLNFEGTRIDMKARPGSGQFMVFVDDLDPVKIDFSDSVSVITLADSLPDGMHTAKVVYAIEGYEKHPEFRGFAVTGSNPQLLPVERPEFKVEFIGNSITCGYGTEAENENVRFSYDTENHTLTYAYLTAQALDADVNVVARSGIGLYRCYGGPREGTDQTMPQEYDYTLLYDHNHLWDHSSFSPDLICVNLGTNDTSLGTYDIDLYEAATAGFVGHLRDLHPQARIVLLTGCMMGGSALDDVKGALDRVAAADDHVYRFDMSPQTGELGYGADWHPSAAQHRKMASELTPYLRSLLHSGH